ncbi:MAG: hypothetical protein IJ760_03520 [Bacteroidales bacterium]|nr:hypothetical protein [Bacteroidales bacterium]
MKKSILAIAAAAAMALAFTACDPDDTLGLTGKVTLYASQVEGTQAFADGDTIRFKSALSNVKFDSTVVYDGDSIALDIDAGTLMIGSTKNIVSGNFDDLGFPLMGVNLRGETTGTYKISCPVEDYAFYEYLMTTDWNAMLVDGLVIDDVVGNLFVIAADAEAYYIGYEGEVEITKFGDNGSTVDGTVNNVKAIYITLPQIEELAAMSEEDRANVKLVGYFPTATFNGEIESRRVPIDAVLQALEEE